MKHLPAILSLAAVAAFSSCEKKPDTATAAALNPESAKTFDATAAYLDAGGDFYLYLRTEQILGRLPGFMDEWKTSLAEMAGESAPPELDAWYAVARKAVMDSGVTQLRAFGLSGIQLEPGLSRTKSAMLTGELENPGLFWRIGGSLAPHTFAPLEFLPADTVYTIVADINPVALHDYLIEIASNLPDPAMKAQAQQAPAMAEMVLGMPLSDFMSALGTEVGVAITADETETMTIPAQPPIVLPKAAVAVFFRTVDDRLYNLILSKLEETIGRMMPLEKSDTDGVRSATVPLPPQGLPLSPTIIRFGDYTAICTSSELAKALARVGDAPPALLRDTPDFERLAKLEKLEGNSLAYISERGTDILQKVQMHSFSSDEDLPPQFAENMRKLNDLLSQRFMFAIGRHEKDAFTSVSYSPNASEQLVAVAVVAPAGLVAGLALPAVLSAREKAAETQAKAELLENAQRAAEDIAADADAQDRGSETPEPQTTQPIP